MARSRPAGATSKVLASLTFFHIVAIALFVNGFLLTRIHLENKTEKSAPICKAPYKKLVWIVIDALRYDFLVSDDRYPCRQCTHQGHMPATASLLAYPHAAKAYRYIAEAPTTTTQRLKAMVSGSLPAFFDVSNAFSASAMDEDNLISQMATAGRRMVFMGDATWANLFPTQFNLSLPFPCFNVKDLDSVDDGIWEHLLPTLKKGGEWDVLVAHYLGVDHAGHSVGVESSRMGEKLRQMDTHVAGVVDALVAGAGPGGDFEDALLVVAGDHGQTLSGDHGGGSPEEVDSVLLAVDVASLREYRNLENKKKEKSDTSASMTTTLVSDCRARCTCGDDGNQCVDDLPQVDLVPTLAAMLDVPIPFGNLGKISSELWSLAGRRCAGGDDQAQDRSQALAYAAAANAEQVHLYLNTYAAHRAARFSPTALKSINKAFNALPKGDANACSNATTNDCSLATYLDFLSFAGKVAREEWTQFGDASMIAGAALFILCVLWHGFVSWGYIQPHIQRDSRAVLLVAVWAGVAVQCGGIFSFFYLLSEGKMVSSVLAAATVALALFHCVFASSRSMYRPVLLAFIALVCNAAAMYMGAATHSGYGFWQRLTVHEPADAGIVIEPASGISLDTVFNFIKLDTWKEWVEVLSYLCTHLIPLRVLYKLLLSRLQKGNSGLQRNVLAVSYTLLAAHLSLERAVRAGMAPVGLTPASAATHIITTCWPQFADAAARVAPTLSQLSTYSAIHIPLHLLIPRLVMASVGACLVLALMQSRSVGARATATSLLGSLGATMLLITNTLTPLIALILVLQAASLAALAQGGITRGGGGGGAAAVCIAALAATMQTQVFFVTGHLCEFAGLQYNAGFVGYEDFHLIRSAALVGVDTYGGMIAVCLGLVEIAEKLAEHKDHAVKGRRTRLLEKTSNEKTKVREIMPLLLLLFGFARSAACLCATLSAGVQRRHLYAWALFAPKFVFEVFFLIITDALLLVISMCMQL